MDGIEKIKCAISELKGILKKAMYIDGYDSDEIDCFEWSECKALTAEMLHAFDTEKETLKTHGRNEETMTKDDWYLHISNVAPLVTTKLRMFYWDSVPFFLKDKNKENARMRDDANELGLMHEQFKSFAKDVFNKSHCNFFLALDAARSDEKYWLSEFMYYEALLLVFELIIESSSSCNSVEEMKEFVASRIDECCDAYFQHYSNYLAGCKDSESLNVDGANK